MQEPSESYAARGAPSYRENLTSACGEISSAIQMKRSTKSSVITLALTFAAVLPLGCSGAPEIEIGQAVEMGPFVFLVERSRDAVDPFSGIKEIEVIVRLVNFEESFTPSFDDAFNGRTRGSMMSFPRCSIEDRDGNRFEGWVTPSSGGRRFERWTVTFPLHDGALSDPDSDIARETAPKYTEKGPHDFRLQIRNPDPRPGQPTRIWIQL